MRERHIDRWLQPVLLIIYSVGRRFDHVECIRESGVGARISLALVQNRAVYQDKIPY